MLRIHSLETFGTHDGPGIRLVIFTQGCNMRCLYCHNIDTRLTGGGQEISSEEIISKLEQQKEYFQNGGGLTISGGEPLLQAEELLPILRAVKKKGFNISLDTNGSVFNETVRNLYDLCDLVLFDIKHIGGDKHRALTGLDNQITLDSIRYREESGRPFWLRYVLVPGYSDEASDLENLGKYFKDYKNIERLEILPYHTFGVYKFKEMGLDYQLSDVLPPTTSQIQAAQTILSPYFKNIYIG